MMRRKRSRRKLALLATGLLAGNVGCIPDNALANTLAEQITQTGAILTTSANGFLFGLPDAILNSIVFRLLASVVPI